MTDKKRALVSLDPDDLVYLEKLAERRKVSLDYLLHRAVQQAYLTENARKHHRLMQEMDDLPRMDWGEDWAELKEEVESELYREIVRPEGAEDRK